jgi:hypothetical protein
MLLVLTNSNDSTADYLLSKVSDAGIPHLRLDTDRMLSDTRVAFTPGHARLCFDGIWYEPHSFSHVWYRRPEAIRSAAIPDSPEGRCALDEWSHAIEGVLAHVPFARWMNHPAANAAASRKLEQLTTALRNGLSIPDTLVTQCADAVREFAAKHGGLVVAKPLGRAYIERPDSEPDSLIFTNPVSQVDLRDLSDVSGCPTLLQQMIRKKSDVRVTIVDDAVFAIEMFAEDSDGNQRCDIRRNNMTDVQYRPIELPHMLAQRIRCLMEYYQLRFAAIDLVRSLDGEWKFLEINPNGQWAWLDLFGGCSIYAGFLAAFGKSMR